MLMILVPDGLQEIMYFYRTYQYHLQETSGIMLADKPQYYEHLALLFNNGEPRKEVFWYNKLKEKWAFLSNTPFD